MISAYILYLISKVEWKITNRLNTSLTVVKTFKGRKGVEEKLREGGK